MKYGEYVRTRKKGIFKVVSIETTVYGYVIGTTNSDIIPTFTIGKGGHAEIKNDIINHSKNIIDLIQVGDYVNGYKVIGVTLDPAPSGKCVDIDCDKPSYESYLFESEIKSILTKEMYEQNCYKVVE